MKHWMPILALAIVCIASCRETSMEGARDRPAAGNEPPPGNSAPQTPGGSDAVVELEAITLTAPADWTRTAPASTLVAAEFVLPRAAGDNEDGRITVSSAGGGVNANIDRWKGQFAPLRREAMPEVADVAGFTVTLVDYSGDFDNRRGPFAPPDLRPNYRMISAIIPVDAALYFVKATGPENTMATRAEEIRAFVRSLKRRE
jgi:hypothetical protein